MSSYPHSLYKESRCLTLGSEFHPSPSDLQVGVMLRTENHGVRAHFRIQPIAPRVERNIKAVCQMLVAETE